VFNFRDTGTPGPRTWTSSTTPPLADGTYQVGFTINSESPSSITLFPAPPIVVDTLPPAVPVFLPGDQHGDLAITPPEIGGGETFTFNAEPGSTLTVTFTGADPDGPGPLPPPVVVKTVAVPPSGTATVSLTAAELVSLGTGTVSISATAKDLAGNVSPPSSDNISLVVCFLPGTRIATPSGEVPVETLRPGDLVLTADGRAVPVRFLGRQTVLARFAPPERANPIRIMAGALAENVPARDLFVSPNHGIVVDGVLAFASALVNGSTIAQVPPPAERFAYYSVETERHEVILAEGCPAETFMDHVPRSRWDNHRDYLALHPDEPQIAEMDLPHAKSHRQVPPEIHARIAERAAALLGPVRDAA
jgi:hypothetical protein